MHNAILACNLIDPWNEIIQEPALITRRGYSDTAFLTGQFANLIAKGQVRPLTVDDIAHWYCETRRDLYQKKGSNKTFRRRPATTWGKIAGNIVETYLAKIGEYSYSTRCSIRLSTMKTRAANLTRQFIASNHSQISKLRSYEKEIGDGSDRLLKLLELNARAEIMALLSSLVSEGLVLEPKEVDFRPQLYPNEKQIGINAPATPDFIVPERRIVGDIKTGTNFLDTFFLSCAGYALTYENQKGAGNDMDFGVIYFFQTRRGSEYAKPVTFAQSYFVVIDDALRDYFINMRNRAYEVVSKPDPPGFPADKTKCGNCPYRVGCEKDGLQL